MKYLIYCIVLLLMSPTTTLCDFVTDWSNIKIQLFKSKSKKPIPLKSYKELSPLHYELKVSEHIEKIVLSGIFEDNNEDLSFSVIVTNNQTGKIVLLKDTLTFGYDFRTYSLPLIPWIGNSFKVPYIEKKGDYTIVIEQNNMLSVSRDDNKILSINYIVE